MSTDRPETHPLIQAAKQGLNDFEKLLEDARDVLFNLAQDIHDTVPACLEKRPTIERIMKLRSKL